MDAKTKPVKKTLFLIRHAESTHNAKPPHEPDDNYWNPGLTAKGKEQAHNVHGPIELLLCSPLRRTLETYVHSRLHVKCLETVEELREWTTYGPPVCTNWRKQQRENLQRISVLV